MPVPRTGRRSGYRRYPRLKAAGQAHLELGVLARVVGGRPRVGTIAGERRAGAADAPRTCLREISESFVGVPFHLLQTLTQSVQAVPCALTSDALSPACIELLEADVDVVDDI